MYRVKSEHKIRSAARVRSAVPAPAKHQEELASSSVN
jgi:hypothetical protein